MNPVPLAAACAALLSATALAQPQPTLLQDIADAVVAGDSNPSAFVTLGSNAYFVASTRPTGTELFRTDGTAAGTTLVADLLPGTASSAPRVLTSAGTNLFFIATDPATDRDALWVSDGTAAGTVSLIGLDTFSGQYQGVAVGSRFVARRVGTGSNQAVDLILSDGTIAGTTIQTFVPPLAIPPVLILASGVNTLAAGTTPGGTDVAYTVAPDVGVMRIIQTDGTPAGTQVVGQTPLPSPISVLAGIEEVAPGFVAVRRGELAGRSTIVVDAQTGSTTISPPLPGPSLAFPDTGASFDNRAFFATTGTLLAVDTAGVESPVTLPAGSTDPRAPKVAAGALFLVTTDTVSNTSRLVRVDAGTSFGVDLGPLSDPRILESIGTTLFLTSRVPATSTELIAFDLVSGTLTTLASTSRNLNLSASTVLAGALLTAFDDANGLEPWTSDGTPGGTALVADVAPPFQPGPGSRPHDFTTFGQRAAFIAENPNGPALYVTDGTPAGTVELAPLTDTDSELIAVADRLWVQATFPNPIVVDPSGTAVVAAPAGTTLLPGGGLGGNLLALAPPALLSIDPSGTNQVLRLGMQPVATNAEVFGEQAFVVQANQAIRTDGTPAGTVSLPVTGGTPHFTARFDGRMWVSNEFDVTQRSNGGAFVPQPLGFLGGRQFVVVGDRMFAIAGPIVVTDGTPAGTTAIPASAGGVEGTAFGDGILYTNGLGALLFTSGAAPVSLSPGPVTDLTVVSRGTAYFVVQNDGLWRTDGTPAGTSPVFQGLDIVSAELADGRLYVGVSDFDIGIEPFVFRPEVVNVPLGASCSGHPTGTLDLETDVDPRIGQVVTARGRARFDGAGVGTMATLFIGSVAPPMPVGGISKCQFLIDPASPFLSVQVPINPDGDFQVPIGIPPFPILVGAELLVQAVVTPSPAPVGLDVTNGLLWVIGN